MNKTSVGRDDELRREYHVLKDDMPHEFRLIVSKLENDKVSRGMLYGNAIEGLGAMTYAIAIAVAAAHSDEKGRERRLLLWNKLNEPKHRALVENLGSDQHYIRLCGKPLSDLFEEVDRQKSFSGILNDILLTAKSIESGVRSSGEGDIYAELENLKRESPDGTYEQRSRFGNSLYHLVCELFWYWPRYSLGFLDANSNPPRVEFDTDELGDLVLTETQRDKFKFDVVTRDNRWIKPMVERGRVHIGPDHVEAIDPDRVRTVFLADQIERKIYMISPFLFNYVTSAKGAQNVKSKYLFLEPNWSLASGGLMWKTFNDLEKDEHRGPTLPGGEIGPSLEQSQDGRWQSFVKGLLERPCQVALETAGEASQERAVFDHLRNQLSKVRFEPTTGNAYKVAEKSAKPRLFYKTGASIYVEVVEDVPNGRTAVAKVLQPSVMGITHVELDRFPREVTFLKAYFSSPQIGANDTRLIGSGIVQFLAEGKTTAGDDGTAGANSDRQGETAERARKSTGKARSVDFSNCSFYVREKIEENLRDVINEVEREQRRGVRGTVPRSLPANRESIAVGRRILRALYIIERAATTLERIYSEPKSPELEARLGDNKDAHFIHRDIRPEVILHAGGGLIKICDFSAAYFPGRDTHRALTDDEVGHGAGTALLLDSFGMSSDYCAPEVYVRPDAYSPTADVFSLGIILNELLFGKRKNVQRHIWEWRKTAGEERDWKDKLYDAPEGAEQRADERIKSAETSGTPSRFDLRELVARSTCHHTQRWSMSEFRDNVAAASVIVREFLAAETRKVIADARKSAAPKELQDAIRFTAEAFGYDGRTLKPTSMVRCAACYGCKEFTYDSDEPEFYACHKDGMSKAIADLKQVTDGVNSGAQPSADATDQLVRPLTHEQANIVLGALEAGLTICSGVVDRVSDELEILVGRPIPGGERAEGEFDKLRPHRSFNSLSEKIFVAAAYPGGVTVADPVQVTKPAARDTQFAEELLMLIGRASGVQTGEIAKLLDVPRPD